MGHGLARRRQALFGLSVGQLVTRRARDMVQGRLRVVSGAAAATARPSGVSDPSAFQSLCLEAYEASQVARGFSPVTMENWNATLGRFLTACDRPAWEVTREDVDRVVAGLAGQGLAASTRRGYVQAFKGFHAFLMARKSAEIGSVFGVRLVDPIDGFNAAKHVGSEGRTRRRPRRHRPRCGWRTSLTS